MGRTFMPGLLAALALFVALIATGSLTPSAYAAGQPVVVNDAGDTSHTCATTGNGQCTLRDAITFANTSPGHDTIHFGLDGTGAIAIRPHSPLPALTDESGVTINGYSQPESLKNTLVEGSDAHLKIELDGTFAGATPGLTLTHGANTVMGLSIIRWNGPAIDVLGDQGNVITGNYIGLSAAEMQAPNLVGIAIGAGAAATRIGGAPAGERNVISGNFGDGIVVDGAVHDAVIVGNLIGTTTSGLSDAGNGGWGIDLVDGATDAVIGGSPDTANTIAFNAGGVHVGGTSSRNRIIANRIFLNEGLGIDLGSNGVNANDEGDHDLGPNFQQNFPELVSAVVSPVTGNVIVAGFQDSDELSGLNRLDFYLADVSATANGEGRTWIGSQTGLAAGTSDFATQPFPSTVTFDGGVMITATTTTNDGTSEFALNIPATLNARPIANAGPNQIAQPKKSVALDGSSSSDPDVLPNELTYHWVQTDGKPVSLTGADTANPVFLPQQADTYTFQLTVSDGLDESEPDEVTISIPDNNAPTANNLTTSAVGGDPRSIRLTATDLEATSFTFKIVTEPQHGQLSALNENNGTIIYTALTSFTGTDSFTFTANDGTNTSAPATVTINVIGGIAINTGILPQATIGRSYGFQLGATGGSGIYAWTFTGGTVPPGLTFGTNGRLEGIPTTPGDYQFGVQVADGAGLKAQRTILISVVTEAARPYRVFVSFATAGD